MIDLQEIIYSILLNFKINYNVEIIKSELKI